MTLTEIRERLEETATTWGDEPREEILKLIGDIEAAEHAAALRHTDAYRRLIRNLRESHEARAE